MKGQTAAKMHGVMVTPSFKGLRVFSVKWRTGRLCIRFGNKMQGYKYE